MFEAIRRLWPNRENLSASTATQLIQALEAPRLIDSFDPNTLVLPGTRASFGVWNKEQLNELERRFNRFQRTFSAPLRLAFAKPPHHHVGIAPSGTPGTDYLLFPTNPAPGNVFSPNTLSLCCDWLFGHELGHRKQRELYGSLDKTILETILRSPRLSDLLLGSPGSGSFGASIPPLVKGLEGGAALDEASFPSRQDFQNFVVCLHDIHADALNAHFSDARVIAQGLVFSYLFCFDLRQLHRRDLTPRVLTSLLRHVITTEYLKRLRFDRGLWQFPYSFIDYVRYFVGVLSEHLEGPAGRLLQKIKRPDLRLAALFNYVAETEKRVIGRQPEEQRARYTNLRLSLEQYAAVAGPKLLGSEIFDQFEVIRLWNDYYGPVMENASPKLRVRLQEEKSPLTHLTHFQEVVHTAKDLAREFVQIWTEDPPGTPLKNILGPHPTRSVTKKLRAWAPEAYAKLMDENLLTFPDSPSETVTLATAALYAEIRYQSDIGALFRSRRPDSRYLFDYGQLFSLARQGHNELILNPGLASVLEDTFYSAPWIPRLEGTMDFPTGVTNRGVSRELENAGIFDMIDALFLVSIASHTTPPECLGHFGGLVDRLLPKLQQNFANFSGDGFLYAVSRLGAEVAKDVSEPCDEGLDLSRKLISAFIEFDPFIEDLDPRSQSRMCWALSGIIQLTHTLRRRHMAIGDDDAARALDLAMSSLFDGLSPQSQEVARKVLSEVERT